MCSLRALLSILKVAPESSQKATVSINGAPSANRVSAAHSDCDRYGGLRGLSPENVEKGAIILLNNHGKGASFDI